MANTISIKRRNSGGATGAPSSLKSGELAFNEADEKLYYGVGDDGSGNATSILSIVLPTASQAQAEAGSVSGAWITPQRFTQALAVLLGIRINAATGKTTPVGGDEIGIADSAASSATKKISITNLFAQLGLFINGFTGKTTPIGADEFLIADSAASSANKKVTITNLFAQLGILLAAFTAKSTPVGGDMIAVADSASSNAAKKVTITELFGQFVTIGSAVVALVGDFLTASSTKLLTPDAMWDAADPLTTAYSASLNLSVCGSSGRLHHIIGALTGNFAPTLTDLRNGASGWVRVTASGGSRTVTCQTGSIAPSGQGMATRVWTIPSGETWYLFFVIVESSGPVILWSAAKDAE